MTPKTLRLPKPGEMLLSVHGSPLGVFKENNMETIRGMENVLIRGFSVCSSLVYSIVLVLILHKEVLLLPSV